MTLKLPIQPRFIWRNVKQEFKRHGWKMPFIVGFRILEFFKFKVFGPKTFSCGGKEYRHFYHLENPTWRSERSIEISLALDLLKNHAAEDILEVGNVMANYGSFNHTVVDKYEKDKGVINEDIISFNPHQRYKLIFSISTLEHVGWDETPKENGKIRKAVENLKEFLTPDGILFFTVPVGYNSDLDGEISSDFLGMKTAIFMIRENLRTSWVEVPYDKINTFIKNKPHNTSSAFMIALYHK